MGEKERKYERKKKIKHLGFGWLFYFHLKWTVAALGWQEGGVMVYM